MPQSQELTNGTTSSSTDARRRNQRPRQQQQQQQDPQQQPSIKEKDIDQFIPPYLQRFVYPYDGDFCFATVYHPRLVAQLMMEGFLPIATVNALLPKLHQQRCVISLPHQLHVSKSTRKKSKRFTITVNQAFSKVIDGCHEQHGPNCWLYPPLVRVFTTMFEQGEITTTVHDAPLPESSSIITTTTNNNNNNNKSSSSSLSSSLWRRSSLKKQQQQQQSSSTTSSSKRTCPVRMYSIEIWNATTGALAGGELGYTVGSIYTSLTGFSKEDSAGAVQLAALGRMLSTAGFTLWDLGMEMEYKQSLGGRLMDRDQFVEIVHTVRESHGHLVLPTTATKEQPHSAKELIDQGKPNTTTNYNTAAHSTSVAAAAAAAESSMENAKQNGHMVKSSSTASSSSLVQQESDTIPPAPPPPMDVNCSPPNPKRQRSVGSKAS